MIRSEIPQLEVVTAIPDAECEDFLAQLLFSQGWSIIYRAFDASSLHSFMKSRGVERRTVISYQSEFPRFDQQVMDEFASPTITFISLDDISFTSHEIMSTIRGKLRAPMLQTETEPTAVEAPIVEANPGIIKRIHRQTTMSRGPERKIIAVTGSGGAPGRTRFATALAEELSLKGPVLLVDADIKSQGLQAQRELFRKSQIEILPLDREKRPTQIPDGDETTIVDLGTLPGLAEAVTDRRWHGSLVNNVLDRATQLIYLSKSTPPSMAELAQFLREYPLLLKRLPVTYVCVLAGHSRELREWESKFIALTAGENRYILRENQLEPTNQGGPFALIRFGNSKRKEIGKIAISLV